MNKLGKGAVLAAAAALLVTTYAFAKDAQTNQVKPVKCYGVNSCRGKAACGNKGTNACSGQNTCKGKGWVFLSAEQCKIKGGTTH